MDRYGYMTPSSGSVPYPAETLARVLSQVEGVRSLDLCTEARQVAKWTALLRRHGTDSIIHASVIPAHRGTRPSKVCSPPSLQLACSPVVYSPKQATVLVVATPHCLGPMA